jgi:hypothetical protein
MMLSKIIVILFTEKSLTLHNKAHGVAKGEQQPDELEKVLYNYLNKPLFSFL